MKNLLLISYLVLFAAIISSCEKDTTEVRNLVGTWKIVSPENDTVFFSEKTFTKKNHLLFSSFFDYSYTKDSITIRYRGPNKILVQPTTHTYRRYDNEITINLTNGCYGFEQDIYLLSKLD
jgi:hypothetical protein